MCTGEGKGGGSGDGDEHGDEDAEAGGDRDGDGDSDREGERHDRWDPSSEDAEPKLSTSVAVDDLANSGATRGEEASTSIAVHSVGSWLSSDDGIRVLPIAESLGLREPGPVRGADALIPIESGGEGEGLARARCDMDASRSCEVEVEALLRGRPSCAMVVVGLLLRGAKIGVRCRKSGVAPRRGRITSGRVVAVGAPICAEGENVIVTTGADMVLGREGGAPTRAAR